MNLPRPTIVIFDMDGTTVRHINLYMLHILEKLDDFGYALSRFFQWLFRRGAQGPIIEEDDAFLNRKKPRLLVHRAIHKVRRKEVDQIVEPCPGIYSVLGLLQKHDIPLGMASNGLGKGYGHDILKTFGLEQYFMATIFREDIKKSKPDPEAILVALKEMKIKPSAEDVIWFIGDRHKDVRAALAADETLPAKIIPIAYGVNAAVAVLEKGLNPEQIIMSYHEMYDQLHELLGVPEEKAEAAE